jgi:hypothetical protein
MMGWMIVGLLALGVQAGSDATVRGGASITPSSDSQQTVIGEGDYSTSRAPRTGRVLSRRDTRLNTRITRDKLAEVGRLSDRRQRERQAR